MNEDRRQIGILHAGGGRRSGHSRRDPANAKLRRLYPALNAARLVVAAISKIDDFSWQGCVDDEAVNFLYDELIPLANALDAKLEEAMGIERGPFAILVLPIGGVPRWHASVMQVIIKFDTRARAEKFLGTSAHIQDSIARGEARYEVRPYSEPTP